MGMVVDPSGIKAIYVCSVQSDENPVSEANALAPPDKQLRPGDFIYAVNGVGEEQANMMNELQSQERLELLVRRPTSFLISINRRGGSAACGITYDASTGISLVIESINEGPVAAWNRAHPDHAVAV